MTAASAPSSSRSRTKTRRTADAVCLVAGIAAAFAPVALTGIGPIDVVERAVIASFVAYVGSHGRRWTWVVAASAVCLPATGAALALAVIALAIVVATAWPKRRNRIGGAVGLGVMVNAVFWYPPTTAWWGAIVATLACLLVIASGFPFVRSPKRRAARWALVGAVAFTVLAGIAAGAAMLLAQQSVQRGADYARSALESARDGNADAARASLTTAQRSFEQASGRAGGPLTLPARFVPGLSQQVQAVITTIDQGKLISSTADDLVATADYDRLQYDGQLDLAQVRALAEPTARADRVLQEADRQLDDLRAGRLIPSLRGRVEQFSDDISEARRDSALASSLLQVTPGLFGADGPRRYLVVFITPAELRGAGGFIGGYAVITAEDGDVTMERSGRVDDLLEGPNQGTRTITGEPEYLRRYGRFHPGDFIQDVTFSPHFPSDAHVLAQLYPQAGGSPIDGVIAVDPTGLAALLQLTGPVEVEGLDVPLSAENAVDVLTRAQYIDEPDRSVRGEILAEATRVTFETLINSELPSPRRLADTLSPATRAGHLKLWSPDPDEQRLFEQLGATGTLRVPRGHDGLSVVQQNSGNNKIDAYLHRSITYLPTIDARTGHLTARLEIVLRNEVPSVDLPDAVVGNTRGVPRGTNLAALTIYTPNAVTSATIDGKAVLLGHGSEQGLRAWDTPLLAIPPGGSVTVKVELEGGLDLSEGYRLDLLPQPVANPDRFSSDLTIVHGTTTSGDAQVTLLEDRPITVPTRIRVPLAG